MFLPGESQGRGRLVGCRLWGHTESDTTEVTQQQQQQKLFCPLLSDDPFPSFGSFPLTCCRSRSEARDTSVHLQNSVCVDSSSLVLCPPSPAPCLSSTPVTVSSIHPGPTQLLSSSSMTWKLPPGNKARYLFVGLISAVSLISTITALC